MQKVQRVKEHYIVMAYLNSFDAGGTEISKAFPLTHEALYCWPQKQIDKGGK